MGYVYERYFDVEECPKCKGNKFMEKEVEQDEI